MLQWWQNFKGCLGSFHVVSVFSQRVCAGCKRLDDYKRLWENKAMHTNQNQSLWSRMSVTGRRYKFTVYRIWVTYTIRHTSMMREIYTKGCLYFKIKNQCEFEVKASWKFKFHVVIFHSALFKGNTMWQISELTLRTSKTDAKSLFVMPLLCTNIRILEWNRTFSETTNYYHPTNTWYD